MSTALFPRARFRLARGGGVWGGGAQQAGITRPHYKIANTSHPLLKVWMLKVKLTEEINEWRCVCVCFKLLESAPEGAKEIQLYALFWFSRRGMSRAATQMLVWAHKRGSVCARLRIWFDGWKKPTRGGKYELVRVRVWMLKAWRES